LISAEKYRFFGKSPSIREQVTLISRFIARFQPKKYRFFDKTPSIREQVRCFLALLLDFS